MQAWRRSNEPVASAVAEGVDQGKYSPICQFGEGVVEGENIEYC
jgi:hypothetical protein